jgi:hypothetical protein
VIKWNISASMRENQPSIRFRPVTTYFRSALDMKALMRLRGSG